MTIKILALTDALGNLARYRLMPENRYDSIDVPALIQGLVLDGLVAMAELDNRGFEAVISQHPGRAQKLKIDLGIFQRRHLSKNFFCNLKEFKRIAIRA